MKKTTVYYQKLIFFVLISILFWQVISYIVFKASLMQPPFPYTPDKKLFLFFLLIGFVSSIYGLVNFKAIFHLTLKNAVTLGMASGLCLTFFLLFFEQKNIEWNNDNELIYYYYLVHFIMIIVYGLICGLALTRLLNKEIFDSGQVHFSIVCFPLIFIGIYPFPYYSVASISVFILLLLYSKFEMEIRRLIKPFKIISSNLTKLYNNDKILLWSIFFASFFIRGIFAVKIAISAKYIGIDGELFDEAATLLDEFSEYYQMGFVTFLSGIYKVFGQNYIIVGLIQSALGALISVFIFLLANKLYNRKVAILASAISIIYGRLLFYSYYYGSENISTFCFLVTVYLIMSIEENSPAYKYILAGISFGITCLIKLTFLPVIALFLPYLYIKNRYNYKSLVLISVSAVIIAPLLILNKVKPVQLGECDSIESYSAINLFIANNPFFTGYEDSYWLTGEQYKKLEEMGFETDKTVDHYAIADFNKKNPDKRKQIDIICYSKNSKNIISYNLKNPSHFFSLIGPKMYEFFLGKFKYQPEFDTLFMINNSRFSIFSRILLYLLFIVGLANISFKKASSGKLLLLSIILYYTCLYIVFFGMARYRIPIIPYFIIFQANGIVFLYEKYKNQNLKALVK